MFLRYYGLREQPFGTTPDPRLLYLSDSHREALASLIYGIETGRGFMALIAEPGMGKTSLLFQLMERLGNSARTVFLFQTQATTREFLCNLIADLGLDPGDRDVSGLQRQLNEILVREAQSGRQFVLVIDEAQNLENSVLESVRMLSNFETPRNKLMQIVLAGQPPLADRLARVDLEQLRQRVSILCRLEPFKREQVGHYIKHRMETAGYQGTCLFTPEALSIIAEVSGGIPRNINNLCFHALSLGYAKSQKTIDRSIIEEILSDLNLESLRVSHSKSRRETPASENPRLDLGSVTINSASTVGSGGGRFPGRAYTSIPSHPGNGVRRRPPKDQPSRWLVWAVVLPAIILATEMFWAYLPSNTSREAVTKSVAAVIHEAKYLVEKYDVQKPAGASGTQGLATPQEHSAQNHVESTNQAPKALLSGPSASGETDPTSKSLAVPQSGSVPAPPENSAPPAKSQEPSTALRRSNANVSEHSSAENFGAFPDTEKAKVAVESNIGAGQITINGMTNPGWQTPHIFSLPLGTYRVSVSKPGYATWFRDVRIANCAEKWVVANLSLPRGVIVIDTEPPGMQVYIDGKPYGPSEVESALSAGVHSYKVVPPSGYQPVSGTFVLRPGNVLTRKIRVLQLSGEPEAENRAGSPSWWQASDTKSGGQLEQEF